MAQTFEQRIEALTGITISSSSYPIKQGDLTEYIHDGVKCTVNGMIGVNPDEAFKFAVSSEDNNDSGITLTGTIMSVVREHDSASVLRPCELIDSAHRYLATDSESLHHRTKYNPGYYILNGKIHGVPASSDSTNGIIVSQVGYSITESAPDDGNPLDYLSTAISNFPDEYEYLVVLYATAMTCTALASGVHTDLDNLIIPDLSYSYGDVELPTFNTPNLSTYFSLPPIITPDLDTPSFSSITDFTLPTFDNAPIMKFVPDIAALTISVPTFTLPTLPKVSLPALDFDLAQVRAQLNLEDIELADKELEVISKNMEKFDKNLEISKEQYKDSMDDFEKQYDEAKLVYETEFQNSKEQFDKDFQISIQEFDKSFNVAKAEFDQVWEEQKIVWQNDFARQQAEYNTEWDKDKIEYQTEFQNRVKIFDTEFQKQSITYTKEFERQAMQYKQQIDQEVLEYQSNLQLRFKNADSKMALEIQRTQSDIATYQANIGKLTQKYQWWVGQYQSFMGQFVNNLQMKAKPQTSQPREQENRRR